MREHYINRELILLQFHKRVLAEAQDQSVPLLERLRFLCISCTNLDEFFEILLEFSEFTYIIEYFRHCNPSLNTARYDRTLIHNL